MAQDCAGVDAQVRRLGGHSGVAAGLAALGDRVMTTSTTTAMQACRGTNTALLGDSLDERMDHTYREALLSAAPREAGHVLPRLGAGWMSHRGTVVVSGFTAGAVAGRPPDGRQLALCHPSTWLVEPMRIPGVIAGPAVVAVAVAAFVRPAPIAQYFVDAERGSHGPRSAMTPGLVRVLAVGLAMIGIVRTLLSIFGHRSDRSPRGHERAESR